MSAKFKREKKNRCKMLCKQQRTCRARDKMFNKLTPRATNVVFGLDLTKVMRGPLKRAVLVTKKER